MACYRTNFTFFFFLYFPPPPPRQLLVQLPASFANVPVSLVFHFTSISSCRHAFICCQCICNKNASVSPLLAQCSLLVMLSSLQFKGTALNISVARMKFPPPHIYTDADSATHFGYYPSPDINYLIWT
jgi:hypothetical protein